MLSNDSVAERHRPDVRKIVFALDTADSHRNLFDLTSSCNHKCATSFCDRLVQHLSSSIQALRSFRSCFETFLDSNAAGVGVSLCSLSRSDRIATRASCSGTEGLNVCSRDSLPLHPSSLGRHWWLWQRVNLSYRPVHSPLSISNSPRDSDRIVDKFSVPPVLMFYPPDLSRSEHTFCRLHEALGTVVSHSQPHSELVSGIPSVQRF